MIHLIPVFYSQPRVFASLDKLRGRWRGQKRLHHILHLHDPQLLVTSFVPFLYLLFDQMPIMYVFLVSLISLLSLLRFFLIQYLSWYSLIALALARSGNVSIIHFCRNLVQTLLSPRYSPSPSILPPSRYLVARCTRLTCMRTRFPRHIF